MHFTLRQIEIFEAVARHGGVSRAAEALALSQSAASTALSELERQFGQALFDRIGKSLHLNDVGRSLLPRAVDLLQRAAEMESVLRGGSGFGPLALGATLTVGNYLATLIVAEFLQRHPECSVRLRVHNTATIVEQVARFELDLGLVEGSCRDPDVETETWVADELVVFCAPSHPLAARGAADVEALGREAWILREAGSGTRETFAMAMERAGGRVALRLELEHTEAIKRAVEAGLGIGCISRLALREAFRRGSLVPVETPELDLRRAFSFLWHRQRQAGASMRAFLALCREMTEGVSRSDEIRLPFIP